MNLPNLLELAKQGDPKAIATLINQKLQTKGITAKTSLTDTCLQVMLEAEKSLPQETWSKIVYRSMLDLGARNITKVKLFAKQTGAGFPDWIQDIELEVEDSLPTLSPELEPPKATTHAIVQTQIETQITSVAATKPLSFWGAMTKQVKNVGGTLTNVASQASKTAVEKVPEVSSLFTSKAAIASQLVVDKAAGMRGTITDVTAHATKGTGYVLETINNNPLLKKLTKALKIDWIVKFLDSVDITQAQTEVEEIQQKYPHKTAWEVAHQLMLKKAGIAAASGLASSLVPGTAMALLGADLAATTALSAELVYQIAAAYGYNLVAPERKAEALAIFGLSFSGNLAIEAGVSLLGNIPLAGAVIGASSNAVMIYTLGYAACRFYEAKLNHIEVSEASVDHAQAESQEYLEDAIAQKALMDQILGHLVLANNPGKTWEQILPELQAANLFTPTSLEAISANLNSLPALETLLTEVNSDFAVPLLIQCQSITQLDSVVTPEATKIIEIIQQKLNSNLSNEG